MGNKSLRTSGHLWTKATIRFMWEQLRLLWSQRNNDKFGDSAAEKAAKLKESLLPRLRTVFRLREALPDYDQTLVPETIDAIYMKQPKTIETWLNIAEPAIQRAYVDRHFLANNNQYDLHQFYAPTDPNYTPPSESDESSNFSADTFESTVPSDPDWPGGTQDSPVSTAQTSISTHDSSPEPSDDDQNPLSQLISQLDHILAPANSPL